MKFGMELVLAVPWVLKNGDLPVATVMPVPFVYYYKLFESVVLFVYCDRVYLYSGNSDWIII